ncbi:MAG: hypothetical protein GWM90_20760, partial [Gemmatimonadetes bacterium]|nr:hypothetical protein [Gemmatimonadota bacterium]NIQ56921.1 hypothetical protein [Gemmatimonadota bacterium]NIU77095.1 hypothetical protein [Gammaproteobacteria bacterium]NIX46424.1 hypothetical protein [Gemmatimonadota bacterium]NIY10739.1 hypothetical protein [Gemmatimonadota bacterium]
LKEVGDRLRYRPDDPGTVIVIVTGSDPTLPARLRDCGLDADVFTDPGAEAQIAFHNTGHPQYFVLGPAGRVRFETVRLAEIPRQLAALDRVSSPRAAE